MLFLGIIYRTKECNGGRKRGVGKSKRAVFTIVFENTLMLPFALQYFIFSVAAVSCIIVTMVMSWVAGNHGNGNQ